ncbi:hypothetical protein BSN81_16795, partial [Acinetobacter baylyi]
TEIQTGIGLDARFLQAAGLGLVHMVLGPLALLLLTFGKLSSSCWKGFPSNSIDVGWAKYLGRFFGVFLEHGSIFSPLSR